MSVDVGAVRAAVEGEGALGMAVYAVCDELEALRAEVEQLRASLRVSEGDADALDEEAARWREDALTERAAVVAWIRGLGPCAFDGYVKLHVDRFADAIERGEHRREEDK